MDRYTEIRSFVLVAEKGSFAAAALVEGVTPVVMGRRLDGLEKRLGVRLMHRSTRGLTLTDLGEQFLEQCRHLIHEFDEAEISVSAGRDVVRGDVVLLAEGDRVPADAVFFSVQDRDAIVAAIASFEAVESHFDRFTIQARAERFSVDRFRAAMMKVIAQVLRRS